MTTTVANTTITVELPEAFDQHRTRLPGITVDGKHPIAATYGLSPGREWPETLPASRRFAAAQKSGALSQEFYDPTGGDAVLSLPPRRTVARTLVSRRQIDGIVVAERMHLALEGPAYTALEERALTNRAFVCFLRDSGGVFGENYLVGCRPDTGEVA